MRLRTLGEQEYDPRIQKLILAELCKARFWLEVAESPVIDRSAIVRIQNKAKAYKRVKIAVIGISIAVVLAIVLLSGCNIARETMHLGSAACQDASWLLQKGADNISTEK